MPDINQLLYEKKQIRDQLKTLLYGSIEIRESENKKYIYVHFRDDGVLTTKYAGEYSQVLFNLIQSNNALAKEYKQKLKTINKALEEFNYVENEGVSEEVAINIDLAKRNLVDSIYKQSILEGIATTYSNTETIVNGGIVNGMTSSDVNKVVNLKRAWSFITSIDVVNYPTNYAVLCQINQIVEDGFSITAGRIRSVPVLIHGSSYLPPIPFESQAKEDLIELLNREKSIHTAIDIVLYIMKKQLFLDGNKRTAILFANHYLIRNALGLIVVPSELVEEYRGLLVCYYEDENKKTEIAKFLEEKCWIKLR